MNKERRKKIEMVSSGIADKLSELREILNEEENSYDNMPENLQMSLNGETSEMAIDSLNEAIEDIENAIDTLGGI